MLFHEIFHLALFWAWGICCGSVSLGSSPLLHSSSIFSLFDNLLASCAIWLFWALHFLWPFLPYARVYPYSCVSLEACVCLQRHSFLALGEVPSLIYKAPWPLLQPVSHHLSHVCSVSDGPVMLIAPFYIRLQDARTYSPTAVGLRGKTCSIIICSSLRKWRGRKVLEFWGWLWLLRNLTFLCTYYRLSSLGFPVFLIMMLTQK